MPVGYHGRASSIVVSGARVPRPWCAFPLAAYGFSIPVCSFFAAFEMAALDHSACNHHRPELNLHFCMRCARHATVRGVWPAVQACGMPVHPGDMLASVLDLLLLALSAHAVPCSRVQPCAGSCGPKEGI